MSRENRNQPRFHKTAPEEGDSDGTWLTQAEIPWWSPDTSQGLKQRLKWGQKGSNRLHASPDVLVAHALAVRDLSVHLDTAEVEQGWSTTRIPESDMMRGP